MSKSDYTNNSIGLPGILFVLFLTLRLTDHIDWAWYWVAAPLWIPLAAVGCVAAAVMIVGAVDGAQRGLARRRAHAAAVRRFGRMFEDK